MAVAKKKKKIFDDRFEILSIVGRGSCSVVYHAREIHDEQEEIALKVLINKKNQPSNSDKLRKEALAMVSSRHRYTIRLDDFHSIGDLCYLSMEFAPEADLRKYTRKYGKKLDPKQAELFLLQISDALQFMHKAGLLHRDIKPDNILVIDHENARLGDFGVTLLPGEISPIEELQNGVGTMNYMPPELLEGKSYDERSDLYALGVSFYEMLSAKHPFEDVPLVQQLEIRKDGAFPHILDLAPDIPKYLANAIMKAIRYNAHERYQKTEHFIKDILAAKSGKRKPKRKRPPKPAPKPKAKEAAKQQVKEKKSPEPIERTALKKKKEQVLKDKQESARKKSPPAPKEQAPPKKKPPKAIEPKKERTPPKVKEKEQVAPISQHEEKTESKQQTPASPAPNKEKRPELEETVQVPEDHSDLFKAKKNSHTPEVAQEPESTPEEKPLEDTGSSIFASKADGEVPKIKKKKEAPKPKRLDQLPKASNNNKTLMIAAVILVCIFFVGPQVKDLFMGFFAGEQEGSTMLISQEMQDASPIPLVQDENFTFPLLSAGMYTGVIQDFIPGKKLPLTLISIEESQQLVLLIGIPGWTPAIVPLSALHEKAQQGEEVLAIQIETNGHLIHLSGQNVDGELMGYFKNLITNDEGEWSASPVKQ